jgi:hypothetical protein
MFHLDYLSCFPTVLATTLLTRKSWIGLLIAIDDSLNVSSIGLWTSQPNFIPANLSSIRVCAFGVQSGIKKQAHIDRVQAQRKDRGLVADGSRTSPAMLHHISADTRRLPRDLCKSTAIQTTIDRFTYLDATQFHEYFMADLPVELAAFRATKIEPSALISNGGMPYEPVATQSKTQARVIRFVSPDHRGNIDTTL